MSDKVGAMPGATVKRCVKPLMLLKTCFWKCILEVFCLGITEERCGWWDRDTGHALSPRWWPEPAWRIKTLKVRAAERSQMKRAAETQAVWPGSNVSLVPSHVSQSDRLSSIQTRRLFAFGCGRFQPRSQRRGKWCQVICFPVPRVVPDPGGGF